jgi:hypothetical protein
MQSCNALINLIGSPTASCKKSRVSACLCDAAKSQGMKVVAGTMNHLTQSSSVSHPTIKEKGVEKAAHLGKVNRATNMERKARKSNSKNSRPLEFCAASTVSPRPCCHQKSPVHTPKPIVGPR